MERFKVLDKLFDLIIEKLEKSKESVLGELTLIRWTKPSEVDDQKFIYLDLKSKEIETKLESLRISKELIALEIWREIRGE